MENRGISSSKPRASYEGNLAYLKSLAGQKILAQQYPARQPWHRAGDEALQNRQADKAHETAQQHEKPFKAKALLAIVVQQRAALGSSPRLTSGSKRSLRSLGRAKARPLTKR